MVYRMATTPGSRTADEVFQGMTRRSRFHLARAISVVEDQAEGAEDLLSAAYRARKGSMVTGITGAPGVGKSTLVDAAISVVRSAGRSVSVIAVDPSSPFTGGAILGDRVRMRSAHGVDPEVFFRSLASRGYPGGVSRHTGDVIALMDAFGFDDILVETVGAGQSEVDIMRYAHTVVVVLAPGMGDDVQAIKAGILEIGDVFCVNKADLPGTDKTRREIEMMLAMKEDGGWRPPVIEAVAVSPDARGVAEVVSAVRSHQDYLVSSGLLEGKNRQTYRAVLEEYLRLLTVEKVLEAAARDGQLDRALDALAEGKQGPLETAKDLVSRYLRAGP
jgi:LAO/AO transport system kinase